VALNTLPLGRADFDNAVETTFGQRFESLADVIDVFEVMAYHQILKRPPEWIARVGEEIKARSGRTTVCTLQAVPLYLEGVHAAERRVPTLTSDDLRHAADLVMSSSVDGVVFFIWRDFLEQAIAQRDFSRVNIIRELASRRPA
jgi:hypothetical protein